MLALLKQSLCLSFVLLLFVSFSLGFENDGVLIRSKRISCTTLSDCPTNLVCKTRSQCAGGVCTFTNNAAGTPCTSSNLCVTQAQCSGAPGDTCDTININVTNCNDNNICTNDACLGNGYCSNIFFCDDQNPCTLDSCDSNTGVCTNTPSCETVRAFGTSVALGEGTTTYESVATTIPTLPYTTKNFTSIQAGKYHTIALASDGTLWGTGCNDFYQLSNGTGNATNVFVQITGVPTNRVVLSFAVGENFTVILYQGVGGATNDLYVFGSNEKNQLGVGVSILNVTYPTRVNYVFTTSLGGVTYDAIGVSAGRFHTIVWNPFTLFGIGANENNQLGLPGVEITNATTIPIPLNASLSETITVASAGYRGTLVVTSVGNLYGFGANTNNELGLSSVPTTTPTLVTPPLDPFGTPSVITQVSLGKTTSFIINTRGDVYGVGSSNFGQLGIGSTNSISTYTLISLTGVITGVSAGEEFTFWWESTNIYYSGQATSTFSSIVKSPTQVPNYNTGSYSILTASAGFTSGFIISFP